MASALAPGSLTLANPLTPPRPIRFTPYRPKHTLGPVLQVTPEDGGSFANTYYDVTPWSPSGRYLALTRFPFQDRIARLGDIAEVVIVDLHERTLRTVYRTRCWGFQMGAILNWGVNDTLLYTNDILNDGPSVGIRIDLATGETSAFAGPKYDLDPSDERAIGPDLEHLNLTQYAYGPPPTDPEQIPRPDPTKKAVAGVWESWPTQSKRRLLVSLQTAENTVQDPEFYRGGASTFFHVKFSPNRRRLMLVHRCVFDPEIVAKKPSKAGRNPSLLTSTADGKNLREAVSRQHWAQGGHHPNWHPDSNQLVMNLTPTWLGEPELLRFCQFRPDGSDLRILSHNHIGSGHPSIDPTERFLLSDCYPFEPMAKDSGEIPIRLIDLRSDTEESICHIFTDLGRNIKIPRKYGPAKLDAHPVWRSDGKQVCFNGAPKGTRQVFIADLDGVL